MKTRTVVRIRNTRHQQTFLSNLHSFWNKSCYADAVLVGKTKSGLSPFKSILVNKSILAAVSHKFTQLLINTVDDVNIIFPDTDFVILKIFVSFIYSGEIVLSANNYHRIAADLKLFFSEWDVHFPETITEKNLESNCLPINKPQKCDEILNGKHGSLTSCREELPVSAVKDTFIPEPLEDQPVNLKKPFIRTYTRKSSKKPGKLVETVSITLDCSVVNHASLIDLTDDTPLSTNDMNHVLTNNQRSNMMEEEEAMLSHSNKELCQEPEQTGMAERNMMEEKEAMLSNELSNELRQEPDQTSMTSDDTNLSELLLEDEEETNKQLNCLLNTLTEEAKRKKQLNRSLNKLTEKVNKYKTYARHILCSVKNVTKTTPAKPKRLPCTICGKEISADYMATHLKLHKNERSYLCDLCGASFVLSKRLRKHVKTVHCNGNKTQMQTHTCNTCGKIFQKAEKLKIHERLHLGLKPHQCSYCDKSFQLPKALQDHERIHTGEKPFECNICQRRFTTKSTYTGHLQHHERRATFNNSEEASRCFDAEASLFRCTTCGATFRRQHPFLTHTAAHRGEEAKLPCKHCSETFPSYKLLKKHKIEKHLDALFKCDVCPAVFTTSIRLSSHAVAHKEGKAPRCYVCTRSFRTMDALEAHKQNCQATDSLVACKVCGKEFKSSTKLQLHFSAVHIDERPYKCTYCLKAFRHEAYLEAHVRIHTGEKPFLCSVCGKSFCMKNNMHVHMRTHTGEKIQCETCGKTFKSFVKLNEHKEAHCVAGEEQPSPSNNESAALA